ncbi:MAG: hypothetical protein J0L97_04790, partial [Alphaproteobacteria bacterium]|nr:hypothetical protein [Alphaproteobacteria bacterium]
MFTYLRYFSAISFIGVVLAAIFVGIYFRSTAADDLKEIAHTNNISLAQGFINTTWKRHRRVLEALQAYEVKDWQRFKQFVDFSQDAFRYFEEIPVAKLNLYTVKGARFLSTDPSEIIFFDQESTNILKSSLGGGEDKSIFAKAAAGSATSRLVPEGGIKAPDGSIKRGSLVHTVVPIVSDSYVSVVAGSTAKVEGYIEIFFDIT